MMRKINRLLPKRTTRGQTALVLVLLTAAALIFFAITLNWGRVAQEKTLLSIAADQSAALLASSAASYGEMSKNQYLDGKNQSVGANQELFSWIMYIGAIILMCLPGTQGFGLVLAEIAATIAIATILIQATIVQPMITSLWNKAQLNQPVAQQLYESGVSTALQTAVGDQVNITDYFDWNGNGYFGNNANGSPNDTVSRFALFYSDRLKMLNQPILPQIANYYNLLEGLMDGYETCTQDPGNPACSGLDCATNPLDPACAIQLQTGFQLNDPCVDFNPNNTSTYNPYCDPCCQPLNVPDPAYCNPNVQAGCTPNPLHQNATISIRPYSCSSDTSANGAPAQCLINNPYNSRPNMGTNGDSPYTLLYDPAYQEYANGLSFLDQFGRDEQEPPFASFTSAQGNTSSYITPKGSAFPNGIYPFFWLMKDYSPEVDNIDPSGQTSPFSPSQYHWCTTQVAPNLTQIEQPWPPGSPLSPTYPPQGLSSDLVQLALNYGCSGPDCCVNYLANAVVNGVPAPSSSNAANSVNGPIDTVMDGTANPALDPSFGEPNATPPALWTEGDNQLCAVTSESSPYGYPYNGTVANSPDGSCELTGNAAVLCDDGSTCPAGGQCPDGTSCTPATPNPNPSGPTVDAVDNTMHILSDFVAYSNNFLSQDTGTLNSTFSTWYPQAATFIAPACPTTNVPQTSFYIGCNSGSNGRLLSIYDPPGYPNLPNVSNATNGQSYNNTTSVDELSTWNTVLTNWLSTNYAANGVNAWCVPPEGTLTGPVDNGQQEDTFINQFEQPPAPWGQLPSIIACDAYNSGNLNSGPIYNYTQCLNALAADENTGCVVPLSNPAMSACQPLSLGRSLAGLPPPSFKTSTFTCSTASTCCTTSTCEPDPNCVPNQCTCTIYSCPPCNPGNCNCTPTTTCASSGSTTNGPLPPISIPCGDGTAQGCINATCGVGCTSSTSSTACEGGTNTTCDTGKINLSTSCDPTVPGSYANWVQNSLTLATDEAPKFAARQQFLQDIYNKAVAMQTLFTQGDTALKSFLAPCGSSPTCADGGPAAQLIYAATQKQPTATLPNAVIYGWQDAPPTGTTGGCVDSTGQRVGCSHIVKITAFAPGHVGNSSLIAPGVQPNVPAPLRYDEGFLTYWILTYRDGYVYVSVKRWDEDHSNSLTFPNNHPLWQFSFHNPKSNVTTSGADLMKVCSGMTINNTPVGFGLEQLTTEGLGAKYANINPQDLNALGSAFMLNDEGDGQVDPSVRTNGQACSGNSTSPYCQCLSAANTLLANAPESHACMEYIASTDATANSGNPQQCYGSSSSIFITTDGFSCGYDRDYTMKFVDCNTIDNGNPPDDMSYIEPGTSN